MQINRHWLGIILLVLLSNGCNTSPEKPEDTAVGASVPEQQGARAVSINISVSTQVNPDINARPSPIVVRVYQLKSLGSYKESDFYGLFEDYETILGEDLIGSEQLHLNPGDTHTLKSNVAPEAQYIAVIAAFRDINQAMWRDSILVPVEKTAKLLIYVDKLSVSVWKK